MAVGFLMTVKKKALFSVKKIDNHKHWHESIICIFLKGNVMTFGKILIQLRKLFQIFFLWNSSFSSKTDAYLPVSSPYQENEVSRGACGCTDGAAC